jgi:metal-sulfur cluster biosynthetic enzyme
MTTNIINYLAGNYDEDQIIDSIKNIYDPEIHINIYDLALIREIKIDEKNIDIIMTLTSANCPEAQSLPEQVQYSIETLFPEKKVSVEVTFEPLWTIDNLEEEIKLELGLI